MQAMYQTLSAAISSTIDECKGGLFDLVKLIFVAATQDVTLLISVIQKSQLHVLETFWVCCITYITSKTSWKAGNESGEIFRTL
jgi:hypothetical protein